ncbi:ABC transporter permease subunit [Georgenia yuyongxinii]|uniref:ABC transporter permease subunit n=1 Tax=Georgenia yuyongxinii TaxID=2589797 RepID=A0A552WPC9_9MICO|nr:ABC transporter permease subunit [Georgenia yuyongxinii]TRW44524.1 ABC transporter permease subunit [Georgenia yuyongxinii]
MNRRAVAAIARRDLLLVRRSPGVLVPMIIVPAVLVLAMSVVTIVSYRLPQTSDIEKLRGMLDLLPSAALGAVPEEARIPVIFATYLVPPLLVLVSLIVASVLATDAIAGERERGTIEGLLLAPVSDLDILFGKLLSSLLPALTIGLLAQLAYAVVADAVLWDAIGGPLLPTGPWLVTVLWFGPACTAAALGLNIVVSARAATVQSATQIAGVAVLPVLALTIGQAAGVVLLNTWLALGLGLALWLLAFVLVRAGARALRREKQVAALA